MFSVVGRTAIATTSASSRIATSRALPTILSGQRFYAVASTEDAETATKKPRRSSAEVAAEKKAKEKARAEKEKAKEREKAKALKLKEANAKKTKEAAQKVKEKAKAKALKAKEKEQEKLKALKAKEKEQAQAPVLKLEAEIKNIVKHILPVPSPQPAHPFALFVHEDRAKQGHVGQGFLSEAAERYKALDDSARQALQTRIEANKKANADVLEAFINSHSYLEIYNHNRALSQLNALLKDGKLTKRSLYGRYELPKSSHLVELKDERLPPKLTGYTIFVRDNTKGGSSVLADASKMWKELSQQEKDVRYCLPFDKEV